MILSHSAIQTFFACQAKFKNRYILKTPIDNDYILDDKNLKYGALVHELAEEISNKVINNLDYQISVDIIYQKITENIDYRQFDDIEYVAKLYIHCLCLIDAYKNKLTNIIKLETELVLPNNSRIDAYITMQDKQIILDYKTCSSFDDNKLSNLHNNFQLNYYASTINKPVTHITHFELLKPMQKITKKDIDVDRFITRILESKDNDISNFYRIILVPYNQDYVNYIDYVLNYIRNTQTFMCNFSNCYNQYGQVCEYFSQCNGNNSTQKIATIL